jgi:hypothetical protein
VVATAKIPTPVGPCSTTAVTHSLTRKRARNLTIGVTFYKRVGMAVPPYPTRHYRSMACGDGWVREAMKD